jgi:hypothetical protein
MRNPQMLKVVIDVALKLKFCAVFGLIVAFTCNLYAQTNQPIAFQNPSFEGTPAAATPPAGWTDCGLPNETPPDTHSGNSSYHGVTTDPQDGRTYLVLQNLNNA